MKFLCGNCKAKYQIPDEKVVGRTLRMKCRRCNHDILIDGHAMPTATTPPSQPARRPGGSSVSVIPGPMRGGSGAGPLPTNRPMPPATPGTRSKPPSALGADFRRHVAAPPAVPARSAPYDLWHVAIQDVPVGPMTRDELARKIEAGAVVATSLCWREGMDDWRPIGELAELAALLRRSMMPPSPPGVRQSMRPPQGRPPPAVPGPVGSRTPSAYNFDDLEDEGSEPTRVADLTGGQPPLSPAAARAMSGAASQPRMPAVAAPASAFAAPPAPAVEPAPRAPTQRQGQNPYAMMAVGLALGVLLFGGPMIIRQMWFTPPAAPTVQAAAVGAATQDKPEDRATRDVNVEVPTNTETGEENADKPGQDKTPGKTGPRVAKTNQDKPTEKPGTKLSAAEQALLDRMGGGDSKLADIERKPTGAGTGGGGGTGPALTANQLMKVVQDNRPALQRCYETALRSSGGKSDEAIKVSVEVVVGMSGTVKSVDTKGTGLGNMNDCIKQSVRRWRFPQSGDESPFNFPVVFQPGA